MRRRLLAGFGVVAVCLAATSTPTSAQTAPDAPALAPFWLVIPAYPPIAQAARVQGVVVVALTVGADGRVQSATIEQDVPLLSRGVLACARDSGFICRGCTVPMAYRLEYRFQFVDSIKQEEAARAIIKSTSAVLTIVVLPRVVETVASARGRVGSGRPLEHAEQEP